MKLECIDREEDLEMTQPETENYDGVQQSCFVENESQLQPFRLVLAPKFLNKLAPELMGFIALPPKLIQCW